MFRRGVGLICEDDFDGVEPISPPVLFLEQPGFHELGHYYTARHYKIRVTPPFFIPVPFALGTFGAFIKMQSAPEDRRSLFDVAVAGPFAGLVLAIPALIIGLKASGIGIGDEVILPSHTYIASAASIQSRS